MTNYSFLLKKRFFDLIVSSIGILLFSPVVFFLWLVSSIVHRCNGIFLQRRIGQFGKPFTLVKLRSMLPAPSLTSSVTVENDPRVTPFGAFLRKYKLDELPQLLNVFWGDMSFVGPRPDVPGFADLLRDDDRRLLLLKPGITGPATLKYRHEEHLLSKMSNPEAYAKDVIWPDKVLINLRYLDNWSIMLDLKIILRTILRS